MKLLIVSDQEVDLIYSPVVKSQFGDCDMVISCGDLSYYYLEYIVSSLDVPLYYVRGNHAFAVEYGCAGECNAPLGGVDLHQYCVRHESGLLLSGVEGSVRYNQGPYQYTQSEMWWMVWKLVPRFLYNRLRYGRYLDIFVTHAPPWKIHDCEDLPHHGIKAFRWLIKVFRPSFHLHGHTHLSLQNPVAFTTFGATQVVNVYGYYCLDVSLQLH